MMSRIYLIAYDRLNRIKREKRTNGMTTHFQFDHTYDSAGNRTALTIAGTQYPARTFGYNYNGMGHMTKITENTNLNNYTAAATTDANGNITQLEEKWNGANTLTNTFEYDRENRLTEHVTAAVGVTVEHAYDGLGRLVKTTRAISGGATTNYEQVRDGLKLVGNIDSTKTNTAPTWTNHPNALRPIESQQVQTNSATQFINVADEISPSRRTYNPGTSVAGDTEAIAAKGRLVLVNGATPTLLTQVTAYPSELFSHRNPTYNENTIALPSDRGSLEISGANLMYEGTRVKTWLLGRDLNPGGRGDGAMYAQGMFSADGIRPITAQYALWGIGNSINNKLCTGDTHTTSLIYWNWSLGCEARHLNCGDGSPRPPWCIGEDYKHRCYCYSQKAWAFTDCPDQCPLMFTCDRVSGSTSSNGSNILQGFANCGGLGTNKPIDLILKGHANKLCNRVRSCYFPKPVSDCIKKFCDGAKHFDVFCWPSSDANCRARILGNAQKGSLCGENTSTTLKICAFDLIYGRWKGKYSVEQVILHELIHACQCTVNASDIDSDAAYRNQANYAGCMDKSFAEKPWEYWTEQCTETCLGWSSNILYTPLYTPRPPKCTCCY